MPNTLYLPELREMLATNDAEELREFVTTLHPARTAEFMEGLESAEIWAILRHADMALRVDIFVFFPKEIQARVIQQADLDDAARLISELPSDDRVDMLKELDAHLLSRLLPRIPPDERRDIQRLRSYSEGTAGAQMTTDFARLGEDMTVDQAFKEIGRQAEDLETIYYLYVVDEQDHLRGLVSARRLVSSMTRPQTKLSDIMDRDLVTVHVGDELEEVTRKVARYDLLAIPVVDDEYRMLGIITHDDVLDAMVDEMAEDAYRSAAVEPLEATYLHTPLMVLGWKRGVWLTVLFFGSFLTAFALSGYNWITETTPWLVLFIPLVMSTGGNIGNQSATLIITALATHEIKLRDWWRVVKREFALGLVLGGFLGLCGYFLATAMIPANLERLGEAGIPITPAHASALVQAFVIPATLILVAVYGAMSGALLPLLFRKIGWDPSLMSNPFVAGLVDVTGIVIYMNVARVMLQLSPGE